MKIKEILTDKGGKTNEDAVGHQGGAFWVLDGATGLGRRMLQQGLSDAAWYVEQAEIQFKNILYTSHDPATVIAKSIDAIHDEFLTKTIQGELFQKYEMPSSGVALVTQENGVLRYGLLGDCRLIIETKKQGMLNIVGTERLEKLDSTALRFVAENPQPTVGFSDELYALLRNNRSLMNASEGYWIMSVDPIDADIITQGSFQIEDVISCLLVSDGFYRIVDTYEIYSDEQLLQKAHTNGLWKILDEIRLIENSDPSYTKYPRLKSSDDASAILLS